MMVMVNNKFFRLVLPNIVIILSCVMVTLFILDYYNPLMGFLSRGMSVFVIGMWLISLVVMVAVCILRVLLRKKKD